MVKQIVTGSGNVKSGSANTGKIIPSKAYMASAEWLFQGVFALSEFGNDVAPAKAFLAAQALECALKAYLSYSGIPESKLKKPCRGHNLEVLWDESVSQGLDLSETPPAWCTRLNQLHNTPYHLRYPLRVNGLVLPSHEPLTSELKIVLNIISNTI